MTFWHTWYLVLVFFWSFVHKIKLIRKYFIAFDIQSMSRFDWLLSVRITFSISCSHSVPELPYDASRNTNIEHLNSSAKSTNRRHVAFFNIFCMRNDEINLINYLLNYFKRSAAEFHVWFSVHSTCFFILNTHTCERVSFSVAWVDACSVLGPIMYSVQSKYCRCTLKRTTLNLFILWIVNHYILIWYS